MKRNLDVPWSYSGTNGPEYWHTLCDWYAEGAQFAYQSPIAITSEETLAGKKKHRLTFSYQVEKFTEKEFKNTIHFVPFDCQSYVLFEGEKYGLTDIHYHLPSEHILDNQQAPLEIHLVHMKKDGTNLVVGVLCDILPGVLPDGPLKQAQRWDLKEHIEVFNPNLFLPTEKSYFHYVGSLTTPPTKGPINWFVFKARHQISRAFLSQFQEEILKGNNRPLQEKKGRPIYFCE